MFFGFLGTSKKIPPQVSAKKIPLQGFYFFLIAGFIQEEMLSQPSLKKLLGKCFLKSSSPMGSLTCFACGGYRDLEKDRHYNYFWVRRIKHVCEQNKMMEKEMRDSNMTSFKFVAFLRDLQEEILCLEFDHYDVKYKGRLSVTDFALSMVASADINHINKFLDRVNVLGNDPHLKDIRISFEVSIRNTRRDAIKAYEKLEKVHRISLSDGAVDIIFHVFDSNNEGNLCSDKFLRVLCIEERSIFVSRPPRVSLGTPSCCDVKPSPLRR